MSGVSYSGVNKGPFPDKPFWEAACHSLQTRNDGFIDVCIQLHVKASEEFPPVVIDAKVPIAVSMDDKTFNLLELGWQKLENLLNKENLPTDV